MRSSASRRRRARSTISTPPTPSSGMPTRDWLEPVPTVNRVAIGLLRGHRPGARHPAREHRALRRRAAGQQRAAVGRARHRQELAGQGGARRGQRTQPERAGALALIEIHREDIPTPAARCCRCCATSRTPLHPVLRRSVLRPGRHQLQIAEGGARRRHRGPARPTSCSTPPRTAAT